MQLYLGVDFHPHQQTVCWADLATGETKTETLPHNLDRVREFYEALPSAIVGIEATGNAIWFEQLLAQTNHTLLVGNPILIRKKAVSRHKSDKRDAELILSLLLKDEFPTLWRRSREQSGILQILQTRLNLVRQLGLLQSHQKQIADRRMRKICAQINANKRELKPNQ